MGCSLFKRYEVASGLILPDQELLLTMQESSHPFVGFTVEKLFASFSSIGHQRILCKSKFKRKCEELGISFPESQLISFLVDAETINLELLLISVILLGRADFYTKLDRLLNVYSIDQEDFPVENMIKVFKDLVHVAVYAIPSMTSQNREVEYYLYKLKSAESCLLVSLISRFNGFRSINQQVVLQVFELFPDLQKICWANGVRMLLIEEDLKLSINKRAPIKKTIKDVDTSTSDRMKDSNDNGDKVSFEGKEELQISKICSLCSPPKKFVFKGNI